MKQTINEIEINGEKYIRKADVTLPVAVFTDQVIVRCKSAGVFFGSIKTPVSDSGTITLVNARRLWYWSGAASLSQLAVSGTSNPNNCKFPTPVPEITLLEVIEVIPCTEAAIKSINSVPIWLV